MFWCFGCEGCGILGASLVAQVVKNLLQCRRWRFDPRVRKIPWGKEWQPTLVFLPGESYGQRILVGYSPWGCKELDMTEQLTYTGEGFQGGTNAKEPICQSRRHKRCGLDTWIRKIPWRRPRQPTLVFLPGESYGQRSLADYRPYSRSELDMPE